MDAEGVFGTGALGPRLASVPSRDIVDASDLCLLSSASLRTPPSHIPKHSLRGK